MEDAFASSSQLDRRDAGDGNDIDGLHNTNLQAPLGTYSGWNIREAGSAKAIHAI